MSTTSKTTSNISNMKQWEDPIHLTNQYKTETCKKFATRTVCDYTHCPFYHGKKERRRSFEVYAYTSQACEHVKVGEEWKDCSNCPLKDECPKCHTRMEQQFHPEVYKKMQCKDLQSGPCPRGFFCAFAHCDGEIQGKRCPEWNFDWGKILPPGVQPQYNTTKKGTGKRIVDVLNTSANISKPISIEIPPAPAWSGTGGTTIPKLSSVGGSPSGADKTGFELVFVKSPKIPEKLPYTFAAILAGKQDVPFVNENNNNNKCNSLEGECFLPESGQEVASAQEEEVESAQEEEVAVPTTIPLIVPEKNTHSLPASFADILSGAKSSSEPLPNRLGSLNSLFNKSSAELETKFVFLPNRKANLNSTRPPPGFEYENQPPQDCSLHTFAKDCWIPLEEYENQPPQDCTLQTFPRDCWIPLEEYENQPPQDCTLHTFPNDCWIPLEEYPSRFKIAEYGVNCCSNPSHPDPWLTEFVVQNSQINPAKPSSPDVGNECGEAKEQYHFDLWAPYYRYEEQ